MKAGKVSFFLGQDDWKKGRDRVKGQGVRIYCTTPNVGTLTQEPTTEMGMRSFSMDDPDGYKITFWAPSKR